MPGGQQKIKVPFKEAAVVPQGWSKAKWYKLYNAVNSRIYEREGLEASQEARTTGRTRAEALAERQSAPLAAAPVPVVAPSQALPALQAAPQPAVMAEELTRTYPLTPLQAQEYVAIHEEENAKITTDLEAVRSACSEKCKSNTNTCPEHSKEIRKLWRAYYLNIRPGGWASYRSSDYVADMKKLFDSRGGIHQIHKRAKLEMRNHSKDCLCTVRINDNPATQKYKQEAFEMFEGEKISEKEIRGFLSKKEKEADGHRTAEEREYDARLAACETEVDKRRIYQEDACTPRASDSPAVTELRLKWAQLFESGVPFTEIFSTIQRNINELLSRQRKLEEKLAELARGKAAHEKQGLARMEKKASREKAERLRLFEQNCHYCSTENCQNLVVPHSPDRILFECGICRAQFDRRASKKLSYFCGQECMELYGNNHIRNSHKCTSGATCTTGESFRSIKEMSYDWCYLCLDRFEVMNYWCTVECHRANYEEHNDVLHPKMEAEFLKRVAVDDDYFERWRIRTGISDEEMRMRFEGTWIED